LLDLLSRWLESPWSRVAALVLTGLVFLPALEGTLIWDDHLLLASPHLEHWFNALLEPYLPARDVHVSPYYRPITTLFAAVIGWLFGENLAWQHGVNVLIHLLNTYLVMALALALWPKREKMAPLSGVLFGLHPLHVEPVAWLSGRPDLLTTLFALLALRILLSRNPPASRVPETSPAAPSDTLDTVSGPGWKRIVLTCCVFFLALGAKEAAAPLPLAIAVLWGNRKPRRILIAASALILPISLFLILRAQALSSLGNDQLSVHTGSVWARLGTAGNITWAYLYRFISPGIPCADWELARADSMLEPAFFGALLLLIGWALLRYRGDGPEVSGLGWFLICLLPVSNLIPLDETVAERYFYLPSVGLCWALGSALAYGLNPAREAPRPLHRVIATVTRVTIIILPIGWGLITSQALEPWKDELLFFQHQTICAPNSQRVVVKLGQILLDRDDEQGARAQWQRARSMSPQDPHVLNLLAKLDLTDGHPQQALAKVDQAITLKPNLIPAYLLKAKILLALERPASAVALLENTLQRESNRADTWHDLGIAAYRAGQPDRMAAAFERLHQLEAPTASSLNHLGIARMALHQPEKGLEAFRHALGINPTFVDARCNLARGLALTGRKEEARRELIQCMAWTDAPPWAKRLLEQLKNAGLDRPGN